MKLLVPVVLLTLGARAQEPYALLPNQSQWPAHVQAGVRHGALTTWLTDTGMTTQVTVALDPPRPFDDPGPDAKMPRVASRTVELEFVGGTAGWCTFGERLPGIQAFYLGSDPDKWAPSVPRHASLTRRDVWPGVDLALGTRDGALAYDLHFAPGVAATTAHFRLTGCERPRVAVDGGLELDLGIGTLRHGTPIAWQINARGERQLLPATFDVDGDEVGLAVAGRDLALPLVIDPPLLWVSLLGGAGNEGPGDRQSIDRDPAGNLVVSGYTNSWNFPGGMAMGNWDGFLAQYDAAGVLTWAAVLGGTVAADESLRTCAFAANGEVWFGGFSSASDFPTSPGCYQPVNQGPLGPNNYGDMVVGRASFGAAGLTLPWSTFLGGVANDCLNNVVAVADPDRVALTGWTGSSSMPTHAGSAQPALASTFDCYVAVMDSAASGQQQFVYGTYWGGASDDVSWGLCCDPVSGLLLVGAYTEPNGNFPTTANAIQPGYQGGTADGAIFAFDPTLSVPLYSSHIGGPGWDAAYEVAIDNAGRWMLGYVTYGLSAPLTFPPTAWKPLPPVGGATQDGYVMLLDWQQPPAQQLVWGTYFGGDYHDHLNGFAIDDAGRVTVTGRVETLRGSTLTNFAVTDWCLQPNPQNGPGGTTGHWDAFVARLDPRRSNNDQLVYSTFVGGTGDDYAYQVVLDERARPIVLGRTSSPTFQGAPSNGGTDVFLTHLDLLATVADRYGAPSPAPCRTFLDAYHQQLSSGFDLEITVTNVPANGYGWLAFGWQSPGGLPIPIPPLGIDSYLDPNGLLGSVLLASDPHGCASFRFQAPLTPPTTLAIQAAWPVVGGTVPFVASDAIRL